MNFERKRVWQENKWRPRVYRALKKEMNAFSAEYRKHGYLARVRIDSIVGKYTKEVLLQLVRDVGIRSATDSYYEVKKTIQKRSPLGLDDEFIRLILEILGDKFLEIINNIIQSTKDLILDIIENGLAEGLGAEDIALRIDQ
jgi:hypothetical protein